MFSFKKALATFALVLTVTPSAMAAKTSIAANASPIAGIENRIGRQLTTDELATVDSLFSQVAAYQADVNSTHFADGEQFTFLGCVGGAIAAVIKRGYALCADTSGQTYVLSATGIGAIGIRATGDVVVHAGAREAIRGAYANGAPVSELGRMGEYFRYGRILAKFASVNVDFFMKSDGTAAKLFFVGVNYGPYFDLGRDSIALD